MRLVLYLLSIIYGTIVILKNTLFDYGLLKSKNHTIPIICIGNLSIGGTGKTPLTNYIAKLLSPNYKIAILSRGYKRKSSDFKYVELHSDASEIGDEPLQLKQNNPTCIIAVNNNRNNAVKKILTDYPKVNIILLDDGFQHRKITAGLNIIVTPFDKIFTKDTLMPLGTLREPASEAKRANIVLISKTPKMTSLNEKQEVLKKLNLKVHQKGYFSSIIYKKYRCVKNGTTLNNENKYSVTLVTGIANPNHLRQYLEKKGRIVELIKFSDHHNYTIKDIQKILRTHNKNKSAKKLILTTEKDATKLRRFLSYFQNENIYYIPINIKINSKETFENQLLEYVTSN